MTRAQTVFVIALAPVFGVLWLALGKRNKNPSSPAKFAFGLFAAQCASDVIDDVRMTDRLDVRMIERSLFKLEDAPRGVVHQLQSS